MDEQRDRHQQMRTTWRAYAAFAVFGAFWGTWGAAVPAVRDRAGVGDGQLGTALLLIGAGGMPAMLLAGRAIDRWGRRVTAVSLGGLVLAGLLLAVVARDMVTLSAALLLVGATSGAADVGINTLAGSAERASGMPVILRAHGVFSTMVVVSSLTTGRMLAGGGLVRPFAALAVVGGALTAAVATGGHAIPGDHASDGAVPADRLAGRLRRIVLVLGAAGALGYAVENAHQSWSAVFLTDVVASGPAAAAWAPAVFAGTVAITRLATSAFPDLSPVRVLLTGSTVAAGGTILLATATTRVTALIGLALAAGGTAVLFPTILSVATAQVGDERRGRVTSLITMVAYLGFVLSPVYVGWWSEATSLPGAMIAVAGLAGLLTILTVPVMRAATGRHATAVDTT
jgi:predicted MFS family arabinose efflux permease